jgi:hypothetical protein
VSLLDDVAWLVLAVGLSLVLQPGLHRHIQAVLLIGLRRADLAVTFFSLIFFPGVLLHEGSHYLMAKILRVRTGKFSLLPRPLPNKRLQLGFVETESTDWFREALIGAAPLLSGLLFVAFAGLYQLDLDGLVRTNLGSSPDEIMVKIKSLLHQPDFWLWFYLIFTVSSMMTPSASDRRAWLPVLLIMGALAGVTWLLGAGEWITAIPSDGLRKGMASVTAVFVISDLAHFILLIPLWATHRLLSRITGLDVK